MKKTLFQVLVFAGFFLVAGFFNAYHIPQIKRWAKDQVTIYSDKNLPVRVRVTDVGLSLFPLGVSFKDVKVIPKAELASKMAPIFVKSASFGIHLFSLFTGRENIYEADLDRPEMTFILKNKSGDDTKIEPIRLESLRFPTKEIFSVPFHAVKFQQARIRVRAEKFGFSSEINNLDLDAEFTPRSFNLQIKTPNVRIKRSGGLTAQKGSPKISDFGIETSVLLENNSFQVASLKLTNKDSVVVGAGLVEGDIENFRFTSQQLRARVNVDLADSRDLVLNFFPNLEIPEVSGLLDSSFQGQRRDSNPWAGEAQLRTKDFKVDQFYFGTISTEAKFNDQKIDLKELKIQSPAGEITFGQPSINLENNHSFQTQLSAKETEVGAFLTQIGIKDTPLHLIVNGSLSCKGNLKPEPVSECQGVVKGTRFRIHTKTNKEKNIVSIKEFKIDGTVKIDGVGVYPKAQIQVGLSKGQAQGEVTYKKGFAFKYKTDDLNFADVEDVIGLNLQGRAELEGQTEGDSDRGTVDMNVKTFDLWIKDFGAGNVNGVANYKSGKLFLKEMNGTYLSTKYKGELTIDVDRERIKGVVESPTLEINDLQSGLRRKAQLPFQAYGSGQATLELEGPLEFTELSYTLKSQYSQGYVGSEGFDRAYFHVQSKNGQVVADRVEIIKGPGSIRLEGQGFPDGNIDTKITAKNLLLEDIQTVTDKGMGLTGLVAADVTMKGYIFKPQIQLSGLISQVSMNEQPLPNSTISFSLNPSSLNGQAAILGGKIATEFKFPLSDDAPFVFKLQTQKYNFAPIFSVISANNRQLGYDTELSVNINLSAPRGGYKRATGKIEIPTFRISRNALSMSAPSPIDIAVNEGVVKIENFVIRGDNTQLNAVSKPAPEGTSVVQLSGYVDMSLLGFLTPFLQELRGLLSVSAQIKLADLKTQIQGSGFIERGYAKLKEFPHPLEQLRSDLTFNERQVTINSFGGLLAGGKIGADGYIRYESYKKFPTSINLRLEDTTLRVPDGVASRGSGVATITGSWFPFLMEGTYRVTEGFMDRSFQNEENLSVRRSSLLPKVLLQQSFDPVEFNLQTSLQGPFQIKNSMIDSGLTGSLLIRGTPSNPVLLGEINVVKGGQAFFREVPFIISAGSVKFDTTQEINPYIYGTAVAHVKSREYDAPQGTGGSSSSSSDRSRTKDYEVNLLLQGRMKDPKIRLTSQPPLDDADIISLLALGVTSQQLERRQSGEQATDLGSAILSQNLAIKNNFFDVKISSTSAAEDTNVTDQKVTLSRQWGPRVSTSVGRTLRTNVTDAKLKYDLNENLAAILNWEGRQTSEESSLKQGTKTSSDVLGVGLEYGVEFK